MNRKLYQMFKTTQEAFLLSWSVIGPVFCKKNIKMLKANIYNWQMNAIYRLMHALFHIWTVIIPRDRYRPDGRYRSRDDNSLDMEKACINLFITYFDIELKSTKLTSSSFLCLDFKHESVSASETPTNLSLLDADIFQTSIDSWAEVTSRGSQDAWYRVIRVLPQYLPMGWYRCGTSGVYVWAKLTLLLINMW